MASGITQTTPPQSPAKEINDVVHAALRDCYDPALPCNLVDLGLIRSVTVAPDPDAPGANIPGVPPKHRIAVTLTLTNPTDDAEAQTRAQIQNRLAGLETVSHTTVHFLHTPPWNPRDITPAGRRLLGLDGNPALVQIR
jgi:metal-sulfur cluster biosynthetic enzyme